MSCLCMYLCIEYITTLNISLKQIVTLYLLQWRVSAQRVNVIEKTTCPVELKDFTSNLKTGKPRYIEIPK